MEREKEKKVILSQKSLSLLAATGVVLQNQLMAPIVKKLKLVGYPYQVAKKTAFIKDMFSTQLEVARFVGAKVSG